MKSPTDFTLNCILPSESFPLMTSKSTICRWILSLIVLCGPASFSWANENVTKQPVTDQAERRIAVSVPTPNWGGPWVRRAPEIACQCATPQCWIDVELTVNPAGTVTHVSIKDSFPQVLQSLAGRTAFRASQQLKWEPREGVTTANYRWNIELSPGNIDRSHCSK